MMREYAQTFRRHRNLYLIPPVLLALVAAIVAFSAAKKYESSAGLWVDNGPTAGSSIAPANSVTNNAPASFEQGILSELLATNSFDLSVGEGSSLKDTVTGSTPQAKDRAIEAAVVNGAASTTPGPQILLITFTGSSPAQAQSVLGSLIRQLQAATTSYGRDYGQTASHYYTAQLVSAVKAQTAAKQALLTYHANHPASTAVNDPDYAQLSAALTSATAQVSAASTALSQAQVQANLGVEGATVRIADSPSLPTSATGGKKKKLLLVFGGVIVGALISLLIVVILTKGEADPWERLMGLAPESRAVEGSDRVEPQIEPGSDPDGPTALEPGDNGEVGSDLVLANGMDPDDTEVGSDLVLANGMDPDDTEVGSDLVLANGMHPDDVDPDLSDVDAEPITPELTDIETPPVGVEDEDKETV